jgi:hypothetical protein
VAETLAPMLRPFVRWKRGLMPQCDRHDGEDMRHGNEPDDF